MNNSIKMRGVIGMVCGALAGALPLLLWWDAVGKSQPPNSLLAWGISYNEYAFPLGLLGAFVSAYLATNLKVR